MESSSRFLKSFKTNILGVFYWKVANVEGIRKGPEVDDPGWKCFWPGVISVMGWLAETHAATSTDDG